MSPQELQVQQKRELEKNQESTVPARFFVPTTDIFETEEALSLVVEMPGVDGSTRVGARSGLTAVPSGAGANRYPSEVIEARRYGENDRLG